MTITRQNANIVKCVENTDPTVSRLYDFEILRGPYYSARWSNKKSTIVECIYVPGVTIPVAPSEGGGGAPGGDEFFDIWTDYF